MATGTQAGRRGEGRQWERDAGELRLRLTALPASVGLARRLVGELLVELGQPRERVLDIQLALSEALANTVRHAYADGEAAAFDLSVRADPNHVRVVVTDEGSGQPAAESDGPGLGIPLMRALADVVHVGHRPGAGTRVTLGFSPRGRE
jgi:serine/threonine-protein kinase RsbW